MLLIDYVLCIVKPPHTLPSASIGARRIVLQAAAMPPIEVQAKPYLAKSTYEIAAVNQAEIGWSHCELIAAVPCGFAEIYFYELGSVTHCLCFCCHEAVVPLGLVHLVATSRGLVVANIPLERLPLLGPCCLFYVSFSCSVILSSAPFRASISLIIFT